MDDSCKKIRQFKTITILNVSILESYKLFLFTLFVLANPSFAKDKRQFEYDPAMDHWGKSIFLKDNDGVMDKMVLKTREWEKKEDMRENHGIDNSPIYGAPNEEEKRGFYARSFLRYAETRITDGSKREGVEEQEGPTSLEASGEKEDVTPAGKGIKNVIAPGSQLKLENTELSFKVRPLQGYGHVTAQRGSVGGQIYLDYFGDVKVDFSKNISELELRAGTEFDVNDRNYKLYLDKQLMPHTVAKISSTQDESQRAFSNQSERRVEVVFARSF